MGNQIWLKEYDKPLSEEEKAKIIEQITEGFNNRKKMTGEQQAILLSGLLLVMAATTGCNNKQVLDTIAKLGEYRDAQEEAKHEQPAKVS